MFRLLKRLDVAFASLLRGQDVLTGEPLPGLGVLGGGRKLSQTEKVRIRGVVERTRVKIVEVAGKGTEGDTSQGEGPDMSATEEEEEDYNESTDVDMDVDGDDRDGPTSLEMELARVYERTIVELGETLAPDGVGSAG